MKQTQVTAKWVKGQNGQWVICPDAPVKPRDKVQVCKSDGTVEFCSVGYPAGSVWGKDVYEAITYDYAVCKSPRCFAVVAERGYCADCIEDGYDY